MENINDECNIIESRKYTAGEKFANVFTHSLGALLAVYGIVRLAANSKNTIQAVSAEIFGGTLLLLFLSSVCYHAMTNGTAIKIFQKIDHSAIYLLIAGTYTPALMMTVKSPLSILLIAVIWCLAITGVVFYCTTPKSKYLSTGLYLLMGWIGVFFAYNVWMESHLTVWLMLAGGIFYSLGCAFYLKKSVRYTHFIWHLFVIAGAVMHYFAIMELLKAVN